VARPRERIHPAVRGGAGSVITAGSVMDTTGVTGRTPSFDRRVPRPGDHRLHLFTLPGCRITIDRYLAVDTSTLPVL
jgi:hypothetical protein